MQLVKYEEACRAVAEAKTIDEVKEITNRAEAARAYAKQAKNRVLELDALEIRVRAERRLGEMIISLKSDQLVRVGGPGRGNSGEAYRPPVTLTDLGIDHNLSGGAQRLAKLSDGRFRDEIVKWRATAETAPRLESPLQHYRKPTVRADNERAAFRLGRKRVDNSDPLDRFRAVDGRRVVDWRVGELDRIEQLSQRTIKAVRAFRSAMPVANPDPLDTIEMIFRDRTELIGLLDAIWNEVIQPSDVGVDSERIRKARQLRQRLCEQCGKQFVMNRPSGKAIAGKSNEGRFCSRGCHAAARKK